MTGGAWIVVATADAVVVLLLLLFRGFVTEAFGNPGRRSIFTKPDYKPDGPGTWRAFVGLALAVEAGLFVYGFLHWVV
jgi:hypothetical protein